MGRVRLLQFVQVVLQLISLTGTSSTTYSTTTFPNMSWEKTIGVDRDTTAMTLRLQSTTVPPLYELTTSLTHQAASNESLPLAETSTSFIPSLSETLHILLSGTDKSQYPCPIGSQDPCSTVRPAVDDATQSEFILTADPVPGSVNTDWNMGSLWLGFLDAPSPFTAEAEVDEGSFWRQVTQALFDYCHALCDFTAGFRPPSSVKHHCSCRCDSACILFGDCCADVYFDRGGKVASGFDDQTLACVPTALPSVGIAVVTRCPSWDRLLLSDPKEFNRFQEISVKCYSAVGTPRNASHPVTNRYFVTYRNQYCSECYSQGYAYNWTFGNAYSSVMFESDNQTVWEVKDVNDDSDWPGNLMSSGDGAIRYRKPDSVFVRDCLPQEVSRCNVTGMWQLYDVSVERACLLLKARLYVSENVSYKNPFCYLCNTNKTWVQILTENLDAGQHIMPPMQTLLNLKTIQLVAVTSITDNCSEGDQIYDQYVKSCRDVVCPRGKAMTPDESELRQDAVLCRSVPPQTNQYGYSLCFIDIKPLGIVEDILHANLSDSAVHILNFFERNIVGFSYVYGEVSEWQTEEDFRRFFTKFYMFKVYSSDLRNRDEVEMLLLDKMSLIEAFFRELLSGAALRVAPTCQVDKVVRLMTNSSADLPLPLPVVEAVLSEYDIGNTFVSWVRFAVFVPLARTLVCPYVRLETEEFTYDKESNELVLLRAHQQQHTGEKSRVIMPNYFMDESGYACVCLDAYQKSGFQAEPISEPVEDMVLFWISVVSMIISIVFLLISAFIYILLPSLRTVAGINNLVLIVALFWAQLLLLVGSLAPLGDWLCQLIGAATHFCWLLVAFAQNVCTFHMFYTLSFPLQSRVTLASPRKMTQRYLLYVFLTPTLLVAIVLIWESAAEGQTGYGKEIMSSSCYIVKAVMRLTMFAVPLALTVFANVAMLIVTIVRLRSLENLESTRAKRVSLLLYTKLSVFTGLLWLLAFMAEVFHSLAVSFVFAVCQGCQGLFIFLAFLAKKRVMQMLRKLMLGPKENYGTEKKSASSAASTVQKTPFTTIHTQSVC